MIQTKAELIQSLGLLARKTFTVPITKVGRDEFWRQLQEQRGHSRVLVIAVMVLILLTYYWEPWLVLVPVLAVFFALFRRGHRW